MMQEDYCSYELSKLLKEKGVNPDEYEVHYDPEDHTQYDITLQMAMKWLREEYNIIISINPQRDKYYFTPWQLWDSEWVHTKAMLPLYDKYEEACEAAIKYCLENLI